MLSLASMGDRIVHNSHFDGRNLQLQPQHFGVFYLQLFEFTFIYQSYSRMTTLAVELFVFMSFHNCYFDIVN